MNKQTYLVPTIDELEMVVEAGFAASNDFSGPSFGEEDLSDQWS